MEEIVQLSIYSIVHSHMYNANNRGLITDTLLFALLRMPEPH
jgi:hypothetical protein